MEGLECGQLNWQTMQKSVVGFSVGWAQNALLSREVIISDWVALLGSAALHGGPAGPELVVYSNPA